MAPHICSVHAIPRTPDTSDSCTCVHVHVAAARSYSPCMNATTTVMSSLVFCRDTHRARAMRVSFCAACSADAHPPSMCTASRLVIMSQICADACVRSSGHTRCTVRASECVHYAHGPHDNGHGCCTYPVRAQHNGTVGRAQADVGHVRRGNNAEGLGNDVTHGASHGQALCPRSQLHRHAPHAAVAAVATQPCVVRSRPHSRLARRRGRVGATHHSMTVPPARCTRDRSAGASGL